MSTTNGHGISPRFNMNSPFTPTSISSQRRKEKKEQEAMRAKLKLKKERERKKKFKLKQLNREKKVISKLFHCKF